MTRITPHIRARARQLRADMTPQERKIWGQLRDMNHRLGLNFRRQAPVGPYIADFVEFGRKLVIEIDGDSHGGAKDAVRDSWFQGQGFTVLRFWNIDAGGNLGGVMQTILDAVGLDGPLPQNEEGGGDGATSVAYPPVSKTPIGRAP